MMTHSGCRYLLLLFLLSVIFIAALPAYAQSSSGELEIECELGFDGYYKPRIPTFVNLDITNSGDIFEGYALVGLDQWIPPTFYSHPVVVTTGGHQNLEIGCFGCWESSACAVPASLITDDGNPRAQTQINTWLLGQSDTLLLHLGTPSWPLDNLMVGTNPGLLSMVTNGIHPTPGAIYYRPSIFPLTYQPEDLPSNVLFMDGAGAIVAPLATYLDLDREIKDTLLDYVRLGGNLIVYYRDGIDPVDGWTSDSLLPVDPVNSTFAVPVDSLINRYTEIIPKDEFPADFPPLLSEYTRGSHGEVISLRTGDDVVDEAIAPSGEWDRPEAYGAIAVEAAPTLQTESVEIENVDSPILTVRNIGDGRVGFAAFDPFTGSPTGEDEPIRLLALYGLLDPFCPTREIAAETGSYYQSLPDGRISNFFSQGTMTGSTQTVKWLEAVGPALIYLLVLPVLVIIGRGRGDITLVLFIIWSVLFTGINYFRRNVTFADKVMMNEASLYWCDAGLPGEAANARDGTCRLISYISYSATTSAARTISWGDPDALLDEFVDPTTWPYGSVTIESGEDVRLPDLHVETIPFSANRYGSRNFILRRNAEEMSASGVVTIGPDMAHVKLDATLPFPIIESRLIAASEDLTVAKHIGALDENVSLDFDLIPGNEVIRTPDLFPEYEGSLDESGEPIESYDSPEPVELGWPLRRYLELVATMPVQFGQRYTESRITGRPNQAYLLMASTGIPSEVSVDHGELQRHAVTVIVISIPIVYED
jgi:hypothetical protein